MHVRCGLDRPFRVRLQHQNSFALRVLMQTENLPAPSYPWDFGHLQNAAIAHHPPRQLCCVCRIVQTCSREMRDVLLSNSKDFEQPCRLNWRKQGCLWWRTVIHFLVRPGSVHNNDNSVTQIARPRFLPCGLDTQYLSVLCPRRKSRHLSKLCSTPGVSCCKISETKQQMTIKKQREMQKEKGAALVTVSPLTLYVALKSIHESSSGGLRSCLRRHSYCKHTPKSQSATKNLFCRNDVCCSCVKWGRLSGSNPHASLPSETGVLCRQARLKNSENEHWASILFSRL